MIPPENKAIVNRRSPPVVLSKCTPSRINATPASTRNISSSDVSTLSLCARSTSLIGWPSCPLQQAMPSLRLRSCSILPRLLLFYDEAGPSGVTSRSKHARPFSFVQSAPPAINANSYTRMIYGLALRSCIHDRSCVARSRARPGHLDAAPERGARYRRRRRIAGQGRETDAEADARRKADSGLLHDNEQGRRRRKRSPPLHQPDG